MQHHDVALSGLHCNASDADVHDDYVGETMVKTMLMMLAMRHRHCLRIHLLVKKSHQQHHHSLLVAQALRLLRSMITTPLRITSSHSRRGPLSLK